MSANFTYWMVACFMAMGKHYPVIFRGYRVEKVGEVIGMPKADNDNGVG